MAPLIGRKQIKSVIILCMITGFLFFLYLFTRPSDGEVRTEFYKCIVYYRQVHSSPRRFVAHIVTIDLSCNNIDTFVTPPGKGENNKSLISRTTSQFASEFSTQVAINGDGFTPWRSNSIFDYYPHPGDPVFPNGFAASNGKEYGESKGPTLFINTRNEASFGIPKRKINNAISGQSWLVKNKNPVPDLNDQRTAPRTAVGLDGPGKRLILIVVDGRQPFYSDGVTIQEMAELMIYYGGDNAINLDGGGSSTLVIQDPSTKKYRVMNSPIDSGIPGRERSVGNHLGIFVR
ncbi:MAG: phosphodiester glycosidase family protein [Chloroflexota bacterium]